MVLDHTILDDPKTPAYKFAYRAFRGMLYGEPDTSPTKPAHDDRQYSGKENEVPQAIKSTEHPVAKRKSPRRQQDETTPKRQRMVAASPSKSILRNPNLPTPRRTQSRDLTVTFKDLSRSLTPELLRDISPSRVSPSPMRIHTTSNATSRNPSKSSTADLVAEPKALHTYKPPADQHTEFDLNAYIAQTEREVRKLIKYGQKMRDIAKEQKADNKRLKQLVEGLSKENETLKKRLEQAASMREVDNESSEMSFEVRRQSADKAAEYVCRDEKPRSVFRTHKQATITNPKVRQQIDDTDKQNHHALARLSSISLHQPSTHKPKSADPPRLTNPPVQTSTETARPQLQGNRTKPEGTRTPPAPAAAAAKAQPTQLTHDPLPPSPQLSLLVTKEQSENEKHNENEKEKEVEQRQKQARERLAARRARMASTSAPAVRTGPLTGLASLSVDRDGGRGKGKEKGRARVDTNVNVNVDSSCFDPWLGQ